MFRPGIGEVSLTTTVIRLGFLIHSISRLPRKYLGFWICGCKDRSLRGRFPATQSRAATALFFRSNQSAVVLAFREGEVATKEVVAAIRVAATTYELSYSSLRLAFLAFSSEHGTQVRVVREKEEITFVSAGFASDRVPPRYARGRRISRRL